MSLEKCIAKAYRVKKERGWDTLYVAVDMHDTMTRSSYKKDESDEKVYFPDCIEALRYLSGRKDIVLILYTSSYQDYLESYYDSFEKLGIVFKYLNENPECPSSKLSNFSSKFYFNVLLDDKAGFEPETDWIKVLTEFKSHHN